MTLNVNLEVIKNKEHFCCGTTKYKHGGGYDACCGGNPYVSGTDGVQCCQVQDTAQRITEQLYTGFGIHIYNIYIFISSLHYNLTK